MSFMGRSRSRRQPTIEWPLTSPAYLRSRGIFTALVRPIQSHAHAVIHSMTAAVVVNQNGTGSRQESAGTRNAREMRLALGARARISTRVVFFFLSVSHPCHVRFASFFRESPTLSLPEIPARLRGG